jgi:hypothetical protein
MSDEQRFTNIAKDSNVGAMISNVGGNVSIGTGVRGTIDRQALVDLAALVNDLRSELHEARRRGEIDGESAGAVEQELDEAARALPLADASAGKRFVLAMRRAKGLVEGLAGLTTKIAEAIAAVQGTQ